MSQRVDAVIVGAGHGGAQAASMLRQLGFAGSVAIIGSEPELPYERPPLSKEYLAGDKTFERILIRPANFWVQRNVRMLLNTEVTAVDPTAKRLTVATKEEFEYGVLIWATGGEPRKLACSGHDLKGVHAVRTRADVLKMKDELSTTKRVVIIGGGYIGLEAAAVLTKLGKKVVLPKRSTACSPVSPAPISPASTSPSIAVAASISEQTSRSSVSRSATAALAAYAWKEARWWQPRW